MEAIYFNNIIRYCENRFENIIATIFTDNNEFIVAEDDECGIHFISCLVVDGFTKDTVTTKEQFEEVFIKAVEEFDTSKFDLCTIQPDELQLKAIGKQAIIRLQLNCLGGDNV